MGTEELVRLDRPGMHRPAMPEFESCGIEENFMWSLGVTAPAGVWSSL